MSTVRLRLHTERLHLEFQGDESVYDRMVEPLLVAMAQGRAKPRGAVRRTDGKAGGKPVGAAPPSPDSPAVRYRPPSKDFGTFLRQLDPKENGGENRIAAFAFFLWNYEKKDVFREEEVLGCFLQDGADLPEDAAGLYGSLAEQRILSRGDKQGTWRLTAKGKAHVKNHLLTG